MSGSLNMGRFHCKRSMGVRRVLFIRPSERGRLFIVEIMKSAIWGQARGWREEQIMTPILVAVCVIFAVGEI